MKNCVRFFCALSFCDTPLIQVTTSDAIHLVTIMSLRDLINVIQSWQSLNSEASHLELIFAIFLAQVFIYFNLIANIKVVHLESNYKA